MKKIALATTQNSLSTILLPGERKAKRISAGGNHTLVLTTDDRVCAFGENPCGQLGLGDQESLDTNLYSLAYLKIVYQ